MFALEKDRQARLREPGINTDRDMPKASELLLPLRGAAAVRALFFLEVNMMTDMKKYLSRFGVILLVVIPILYLTQGANALTIIFYKISLAMIGVFTAELIWAVFFRPVYGATEALAHNAKQSVMVFRGLLYAAVILAFTLGL